MAEPVKNTKNNRWLLTFNSDDELDVNTLWDVDAMEYMVGQREEAPTTGKRHYHFYIVFKKRKMFSTVKKWAAEHFAGHPDIEAARGNEEQCKTYVTKDERIAGPWEFGVYEATRGQQGKRSDLIDAADKIKKGIPMDIVAAEHPGSFIRYYKGLEAFHQAILPVVPVERDMHVIVLWGETSTGKTHRVMHTFPDVYQVRPGRDPFGGYTEQREILFDEFDYHKWTIQDMNTYLDKWRCPLDCRYTDKKARWSTVIICSNSSPDEWWPDERDIRLKNSFNRRIGLTPGGTNCITIYVRSREQELDLKLMAGLVPIIDAPDQTILDQAAFTDEQFAAQLADPARLARVDEAFNAAMHMTAAERHAHSEEGQEDPPAVASATTAAQAPAVAIPTPPGRTVSPLYHTPIIIDVEDDVPLKRAKAAVKDLFYNL